MHQIIAGQYDKIQTHIHDVLWMHCECTEIYAIYYECTMMYMDSIRCIARCLIIMSIIMIMQSKTTDAIVDANYPLFI
jgi:hypothetical protein